MTKQPVGRIRFDWKGHEIVAELFPDFTWEVSPVDPADPSPLLDLCERYLNAVHGRPPDTSPSRGFATYAKVREVAEEWDAIIELLDKPQGPPGRIY